MAGRLIVIEGPDGSGKSTLARGLSKKLMDRGQAVRLLAEPGGTPLGDRLRSLLKDEEQINISARAEALLFAASRAQLCQQVIGPALARGEWVILDRFIDSSIIYQGLGRELPRSDIAWLSQFATTGLKPDRVLVLTTNKKKSLARRQRRDGHSGDRIEQAGKDFTARVLAGYEQLASSSRAEVCAIDGNGTAAEAVAAALAAISDLE